MNVGAKLGMIRGILMARSIRALDQTLQNGEDVQAVVTGTDDGRPVLLAATDRRLLAITDRGTAVDSIAIRYQDVITVRLSAGNLTKLDASIETMTGAVHLGRLIRKEWAVMAEHIERRRAI